MNFGLRGVRYLGDILNGGHKSKPILPEGNGHLTHLLLQFKDGGPQIEIAAGTVVSREEGSGVFIQYLSDKLREGYDIRWYWTEFKKYH